MVSASPLRVAVVSRNQLTRAGLAAFLSVDRRRADISDMASLDGHLGGQDVAIYDLAGLIGTTENDLAHLLGSGKPVVALEPRGRHDLAEGALRLGVAAVVPMTIEPLDLLAVLERAAAGEHVDQSSADRDEWRERVRRQYDLTEREIDILGRIGTGVSNAEICADLYLSINTVKTYVRSSYKKIGVTSRSQAVLWALEHLPHPTRRP